MTVQTNGKGKSKGSGFLKGCLVTLLILLVLLVVAGGIGWSFVAKEHREAASLPLDGVDFSKLKDGTYHGLYEGGMYKWRVNECDVTVTNGKVTAIQLVENDNPSDELAHTEMLYERVIAAQSLQVDTISGATLTSKAYLKAVENALLQAQD